MNTRSTQLLWILASLSLGFAIGCPTDTGDDDDSTVDDDDDDSTIDDDDDDSVGDDDDSVGDDDDDTATGVDCGFATSGTTLPGDIDITLPVDDPENWQTDFDQFAWESFLAVNAPSLGAPAGDGLEPAQWHDWPTTVDLIEGGSTDRWVPTACDGMGDLPILDEVGKVDDLFLEANGSGLSESPTIDRYGAFTRYQIQVSPASAQWVLDQGLNTPVGIAGLTADVNFPCSDSTSSGDPSNADSGSMTIKTAWVPVADGALPGVDAERYYSQDFLVWTPGYRRTDGTDHCEQRTMALVGMHLVRKTQNQPAWVWATFEHQDNAPDCAGLPPEGTGMQPGPGPNAGCPESLDQDWLYFGEDCLDGDACQSCNETPASNAPTASDCINPEVEDSVGWCLDEAPASVEGRSRLCRQVSIEENFPSAHEWNVACSESLGGSVWAKYQLVSAQWLNQDGGGCNNIAADVRPANIFPQVAVGQDGAMRSYVANTSMESYERSNCMNCHHNSNSDTTPAHSLDFSWWLALQSTQGPN